MMNSENLFREEALRSRRAQWMGTITLESHAAWWFYTALSVTVALVAISLLVLGSYTRQIRVEGTLAPKAGVSIVSSSISGVVTQLRHPEGAEVVAGEPLAMILSPAFTPFGGDVSASIEETLRERSASSRAGRDARYALSESKMHAVQVRSASLRSELENLAVEIANRRKQVQLAQSIATRYRQISDQGYVSTVQLQLQENQVLEAGNALRAMQRQQISLRRELADNERKTAELFAEKRVIDAEFDTFVALLDLERVRNAQTKGIELRAPLSGTIGNLSTKVGQHVNAGESVLSVVAKDSPLQGEMYLPSEAIAFIKVGDRVAIRYHAFPYQKFGHRYGVVNSVSDVALATVTQVAMPPRYKVTFSLDQQYVLAYGAHVRLKPGMAFQASVLGDKRRLYEWLLEPLYSVRGY